MRLTIFPYKVQFKTLRTHLILDEPLSRELPLARQQVYSALRDCRAFISNFRWGEARDFKFEIRSGNEIAICGGSISLSNDTTVCVQIPRKATIRLIADGKLLAQKYADRHGIFKKTGDPAKDYRFLWVTNFPMFEYDENERRWVAAHHPFTSPHEEDMDKLETDPAMVRALAYDVVLNGNGVAAVVLLFFAVWIAPG